MNDKRDKNKNKGEYKNGNEIKAKIRINDK